MTKDLESTLGELGPGYREVVERVCAAYASAPAASPHRGRLALWSLGYLAAASLVIVVALAAVFSPAREGAATALTEQELRYTAAYVADAAACEEIVAAQHPDGSWANDFLTRQNAAALRSATGVRERIAYKKALRYLREQNLAPLTDAELRERGDAAARRVRL